MRECVVVECGNEVEKGCSGGILFVDRKEKDKPENREKGNVWGRFKTDELFRPEKEVKEKGIQVISLQ